LAEPVSFEDCVFEEEVCLDEAIVPALRLVGCELPRLSARNLQARGDLVVEHATAHQVVVEGAQVGGRLRLSATRLSGDPSLNAAGVRVGRDLIADGCAALGPVYLTGARIDGTIEFRGATFDGLGGAALDANAIRVGGDVRFYGGCVAHGVVWLTGADIEGRLWLSGARLCSAEGSALVAESLHVGQAMFCNEGFRAGGEVRLVGARIGGPLSLEDAELVHPDGWALNAWGIEIAMGLWCGGLVADGDIRLANARVRGPLTLEWAKRIASLDLERANVDELTLPLWPRPTGVVTLRGARAGQFNDFWSAHPDHRYKVVLRDFAYDSLEGPSSDVSSRLDWLAHAVDGFSPGAYDRLATVLRAAGREEDAREVSIARECARRATLHRARRPASRFLAATVGYGYRPWRAFGWLATVVVAGWCLFGLVWRDNVEPAGRAPDFHPLLFSLDAVLPVVQLGQDARFSVMGAAQWWYAFSVLAGWVLATVLVAALTARLVRD
jgi:hypothetical protein